MAKGVFRRVGDTAVPAGRAGRDALLAIPDGKTFVADFKTARNADQHELFWTLAQLGADATDSTKEAVVLWLKHKLNLTDMVFLPDGSMKIVPKSIAWESMEQAEFNSFFQAAVNEIAGLLGSAPKDVLDRFNDLLDPEKRADMRKRLKAKVAA